MIGSRLGWFLSILIMLLPLFLTETAYANNNLPSIMNEAKTVTGTITDAADGTPLIGVNVLVRGTGRGTITDLDGYFSLEAEDTDVLVFSYTGYTDLQVSVGNQTTFNLELSQDVAQLDEVVVIGYGTQKKSHLTGSVSKVVNEKLDQIAVPRIDDALIGQVSGVNIQTTSAEAGAAPTITIRGFGSVNADSGPAVVVDGLVVDADFLGNLDINDIHSFEVLKDAASAAIYGSEGSNGVILITTKSGEAGKTKFTYDTYFGRKEAFGSDNYKKSVAEWSARELAESGTLTNHTKYALQLVEDTGVDRDWQDVFFDGGNISSLICWKSKIRH